MEYVSFFEGILTVDPVMFTGLCTEYDSALAGSTELHLGKRG